MKTLNRLIQMALFLFCAAGLFSQGSSDGPGAAAGAASAPGEPAAPGAVGEGSGETIALFFLEIPGEDPGDAREILNAGILGAFKSAGGFRTERFYQGFSSQDARLFIKSLERGEWEAGPSGDYGFGGAVFSRGELEQALGCEFGAVPSVYLYEARENEDEPFYEVELGLEWHFLDLKNGKLLKTVRTETVTSGNSPAEALEETVRELGFFLAGEIPELSELRLRIVITEVLASGTVVIGAGTTQGVRAGDEFLIVREDGQDSRKGLWVVVSRSEKNYSYGYVVRGDEDPVPGDLLKKVPRAGLETWVSFNYLFPRQGEASYIPGIRLVLSRRVFRYRPFLGLEVPITPSIGELSGVPLTIQGGCEINWHFRRFLVTPSLFLGLNFLVPPGGGENSSGPVSHWGGGVDLKAAYAVNNTMRLFLQGGITAWKSTGRDYGVSGTWDGSDYGGFILGGGINFKF